MLPTTGNLNRWAVVGVLLSGGVVLAAQTRADTAKCGQAHSLAQRLADSEAEPARLRAALGERERQALYERALELGVVEAVKASKLPERQQRRIAIAIVREAELNDVDPLLIVAVIQVESAFNTNAVSPVGALGLMQVMPATGRWLAERRGAPLKRTSHLFDSELNIELGTTYLSELIARFGRVDEALAAYNAGPTGAKRILAKRDTRVRFMAGYPTRVLEEFRKLASEAEARMARTDPEEPLPDGRG